MRQSPSNNPAGLQAFLPAAAVRQNPSQPMSGSSLTPNGCDSGQAAPQRAPSGPAGQAQRGLGAQQAMSGHASLTAAAHHEMQHAGSAGAEPQAPPLSGNAGSGGHSPTSSTHVSRQLPAGGHAGSMEAIAQAGRHFCGFKDSQGFQGFAPLVVAPRPAASNASGGTARSQAQPRGPDQLTQPPQRACSLQSQEARSPSPIGRPAALDTGPQAQPSTRMPRGHSGSASARQPDATPPRLISKKAASQRHSTGSLGGRSVSGHHQGMRHDQSPSQGDHAHITAAQTVPPFSDQRAASAEAARPDQQTSSSHLSHATSKRFAMPALIFSSIALLSSIFTLLRRLEVT